MIIEERIAQENSPFLNAVMAQYDRIAGKDPLSHFREKAWKKFLFMGLPSKDDEAFHAVRVRELYSEFSDHAQEAYRNNLKNREFDKEASQNSHLERATVVRAQGASEDENFEKKSTPSKTDSSSCFGINACSESEIAESIASQLLPECKHAHVVFVNGTYCPHLSELSALPLGSLVLPLQQAIQRMSHFLQAHLLKSLERENDPFALLNLALHSYGLFLYIAPKQRIEVPIQCIQITTDERMLLSAPRVQLILGAHSDLKWISTHLSLGSSTSHCSIPLIDLYLDEAAHLDVISHLSPAASDWCFDNLRALLKQDAALKVVSVIGGSKATRQNIYVQCAGEQAQADIKGLWMLRDNLRAHAFAIIDHNAPRTRSMQLFKGILLDSSQSSFEGKIIVREIAQKTEAYQLNKNLVLGHAALSFSKPNLEIFADDVKASHGATIARPDEAHIFYLKSRGIDESQAKALLMHGFYQEILQEIPYPFLQRKIEAGM